MLRRLWGTVNTNSKAADPTKKKGGNRMSNIKAKSAARHKSSGFSLDYTCALSVRQGRRKIQAAAGTQQKEERRKRT